MQLNIFGLLNVKFISRGICSVIDETDVALDRQNNFGGTILSLLSCHELENN